ncbi:MAG TPA: class I SAM-dependent methyltransferase [Solirubrobacteraceae bacterium]|jgi:SAM-dependent methyltransferase|nr:class I SAM-dependent methyltransferase [Solirubrobacteraceae bacterium]
MSQSTSSDAIEQLRAFSNSPFSPEPPRRSRIVDVIFAVAQRGRYSAHETPHLYGGLDVDKTRYEYEGTDEFWSAFAKVVRLDDLSGCDVLDVGCGWGGKVVRYAESTDVRSIVAFDLPGAFDPEVPQAFAREHNVDKTCTFLTGIAEEMPFDDDTFDVVVLDDVFEHVRRPVAALAECYRVLRSSGIVIIRFPSIRMLHAHHLDRVMTYPGLHYMLPLKIWAAGLNYRLLEAHGTLHFEPFDEVVSTPFHTPFHQCVTRDLNGQSFADFKTIVARSGFEVVRLEIVPLPPRGGSPLWRAESLVRRALSNFPPLREMLGMTIAFVGRKPARFERGSCSRLGP